MRFPAPAALATLVALPALAAPASDADARYQSMLAAAMAGETTIDGWRDLRYAYAATSGYAPDGAPEAKTKMLADYRADNCTAALADAKQVIDADYVEPDAHLVASVCDDKLGKDEDAKAELGVGMGLITSIETTGDGLSPANAWVVISVGEEYSVLRVKGLRVTQQALIHQDGHSFDQMTTQDDKGASQVFYFQVDRVMAAEAAALKAGSVSEGGPPR
jgi:hypothetical protein